MRKFTASLLLALLTLTGAALAQTSPMVVADNVLTKSPLYYNHTPNIARSSTGDLVAVWNSGDKQVVFSKYDPSFDVWSPPVPISSAGERALKAGIIADDSGNLYCVWQERETSGEDYAIFFSKYDGINWSDPVNLTGNGVENEEASVMVDTEGNVFVAWNTDGEKDTTNYVFCIKSTDGGQNWSAPDTLSSKDGDIGGTSTTSGRPFLASAPGGKLVCAWHEEPDGHPDRESFINQYDGSNWLGEMVNMDVADSANSMYPSVAVNSMNEIIMVYVSYKSPFSLVMKKKAWDDASWPAVPDTIAKGDNGITKPFIGIDSKDNLYLVYRRDNAADTTYGMEEIVYVTSTDGGATWSEPVRLSRENYDAGYVTLAPKIRDSGVDVLWRESYKPYLDDADTTTILYGHIDLVGTAIGQNDPKIVNNFVLNQNYPNPFNPSTEISFYVARPGTYELAVYNILGEKIRTLSSGKMAAGRYNVTWDATNAQGVKVGSGIYFYQLSGNNVRLTQKMILMQ